MNFWVFLLILITSNSEGKVFTFTNVQGDPACILFDTNFVIHVTASENGKLIGSEYLTSEDPTIQLDGMCSSSFPYLSLTFEKQSKLYLKFSENENGIVELNSMFQFIPNSLFGGAVSKTDLVIFNGPNNLTLSDPFSSFSCREQVVETYTPIFRLKDNLTYTVNVTIFNVKLQAFNVVAGQFSNEKICELEEERKTTSTVNPPKTERKTTTKITNSTTVATEQPVKTTTGIPSTTVITTTRNPISTSTQQNTTESYVPTKTAIPPVITTTSAIRDFVLKNGDFKCAVLESKITIYIPYLAYSASSSSKINKTAKITIPADAKVSGDCQRDTYDQFMVVQFFNESWFLSFLFMTEDRKAPTTSEDQADLDYKLADLALIYVYYKELFPHSVLPPGTQGNFSKSLKGKDNGLPRKPNGYDYYRCDNKKNISLTHRVTVEFENLKLNAFLNGEEEVFAGDPKKCDEDDDDDDDDQTVPIVIGCVLGGVLVLFIIAFIVAKVKRSKKRKYETF